MNAQLELVLLDVNETLFCLEPVETRMAEVGLDGQFELWFTRILRDGFAAAAAGRFAGFRDLASHHLRKLLRRHQVEATDALVSHSTMSKRSVGGSRLRSPTASCWNDEVSHPPPPRWSPRTRGICSGPAPRDS